MFSKTLPWIIIPCILLLLTCGSVSKRMWDFEVVHVASYNADESMLNISVSIQQISRHEMTVSAVFDWKFDANENAMIEGHSYSCFSGNEKDYKPLPYKINKMTLFEFFNSFYNTIVYKNVEKCSNLPNFMDGFTPPFPQMKYKFENCLFTGDGVPEVLSSGYYKVVFIFSGQIDNSLAITFDVKAKTM